MTHFILLISFLFDEKSISVTYFFPTILHFDNIKKNEYCMPECISIKLFKNDPHLLFRFAFLEMLDAFS